MQITIHHDIIVCFFKLIIDTSFWLQTVARDRGGSIARHVPVVLVSAWAWLISQSARGSEIPGHSENPQSPNTGTFLNNPPPLPPPPGSTMVSGTPLWPLVLLGALLACQRSSGFWIVNVVFPPNARPQPAPSNSTPPVVIGKSAE